MREGSKMAWKDETHFQNVDDLFEKLRGLGKPVACRGQADSDWTLQTSLDRILDARTDYATRLDEENIVLDKFRSEAGEYLGSPERVRVNQNNKMSALTGLQHYRAPTRLLDWTSCPQVALYFAAIDHHDKNGTIWWFDQEAFEEEVHRRWESKYHMRRYPDKGNQVDLNDTAFRPNGRAWITKLHCAVTFHRIRVQQAFFTVAGRLSREHGELIADVLDEGEYGRIVIAASLKEEILDELRKKNIHSRRLDYPGADLVGARLKGELEERYRQGRED